MIIDTGNDIAYYGNDALSADSSMNTFLYKECTTFGGYQGIIIGYENSSTDSDCYYIVLVPILGKVVFELANDSDFVKSIKI